MDRTEQNIKHFELLLLQFENICQKITCPDQFEQTTICEISKTFEDLLEHFEKIIPE